MLRYFQSTLYNLIDLANSPSFQGTETRCSCSTTPHRTRPCSVLSHRRRVPVRCTHRSGSGTDQACRLDTPPRPIHRSSRSVHRIAKSPGCNPCCCAHETCTWSDPPRSWEAPSRSSCRPAGPNLCEIIFFSGSEFKLRCLRTFHGYGRGWFLSTFDFKGKKYLLL